MSSPRKLKLLFTADLHWGIAKGMAANNALYEAIKENTPDVLVLAGDIGHAENFDVCLDKFASLNCIKVLVPGNHDIWVSNDDERGNSWEVYTQHLPMLAQKYGFHYLDQAPLHFPEWKLSLVGNINWYDYSWSEAAMSALFPEEVHRFNSKRFLRGQHNDFNFIRWQHDDKSFTKKIVAELAEHLQQSSNLGHQIIVVTHHPACRAISFPMPDSVPTIDSLLWEALGGNQLLEEELMKYKGSIAYLFSGHTHRERKEDWEGMHAYNIGGDYHYKRQLELSWPDQTVIAREFLSPSDLA
jgi:predicted phosphohydrolase